MSNKPEIPEKLKFQVLFENKIAAFFITQPDGSILDANRTAEKMFGYSVEEFREIGREGVIDQNTPGFLEKLKERDENGVTSGELIAIRKGGEKFPCEFSSSVYEDKTGERYTATFLIDITDRKRAELRTKIFLNNTDESFILLDRELKVVAFNDQFKRLYKKYFDIEIVHGENIIQYAEPERRENVKEIYKRVLNGKVEQYNITVPLPDKSEKVFSICYKPAQDEQEEIIGVFVSATEITESYKVQKSNERFEFVTKATSEVIWDYEIKTGKLFWGEGYQTLLGYNNFGENYVYEDWSEKIHPDDIDRVEKRVKEVLEGSESKYQQKYRLQKADGSYAIVLDKGVVIRDNKGKVERLIGAIEDITEQREVEELLDQANRLAKIGSWKYDLETQEIFWTDITRGIHEVESGYNPRLDEVLSFYKEGDNRDKILDAVQEAVAKGTSWDLELQIVTAKGNEKWVRTIGEVEMYKDKPIRMYGSFQDIDDRKVAELAIKKATEERIEILERIGDGFFAVDKDFTVTYWNQRASELLKMPKVKIIGKHLWDLFADATENISYQKYNQAINEQRTIHFEDYYDGVKRWFEVSAYPSQNGLSVFFKDITQRKATEELLTELNQSLEQKAKELASSNADLENFAFVASHDLQEPLRMITSFLTQLETRYGQVLDEKGKKYIYYATDGAKRMRRIILDLLEYSRVGRMGIEKSHLDLKKIVQDVELLYKKLIHEKKAVINYKNLPKVWAARSPMQQILQNLIQNALNYSRSDENPVITITSEESKDFWKISVRDNGVGIHPDNREKIFNLFQRLQNSETYRGTGLGLAISKKIVEDQGGQIWVDSEEGKGSVFHFTIEKKKD
tara:strand:+ start:1699 stop:4260 length:2562 start_codon:yes stop_codon:yes gene_type:complete